jgi:iron complex outermembrane recepter protein
MIFRNILLFCLLITGIFLPYSLRAQTLYPDDQTLPAQRDTTAFSGKIDEVTVTSFRTPYNLMNIPAPVNLVLPVQLEQGSALTPVEALNQVPGVLMHNATLSTNRLTIRGIGTRTPYASNKIKAYFGEIPLTGGDGETTLEDLENPGIQRIEIIKGPSSSLYGAGLGGTILFHPRSIGHDFVQHQTTIASFDTYKNTLTAGIHQRNLYVFALGSILNSQGFRENNATNRANIMLHSEYALSDKLTLEALLKFTKMKAHIPSSIDLNTYLNNPEKAAANWLGIRGYEAYTKGQAGISMNYRAGNGNRFSLAGFGSFREADEPRPFNLLLESSDYFGGRGFYQKYLPGENVSGTLTAGFEIFRENYNWSTWSNQNPDQALSDNHEERDYENLFLQVESNLMQKLYISTGLNANFTRFDYTDNFPDDGDKSGTRSYNPVISPRLGINYRLNKTFSFFANASHGFSTPSFEETLLPEGQINTEIKPETGWNFEGGIRTNFNNRIHATVSYYRIYIQNLLVARRTGDDAFVGVNAGKSLHPGLESEIRWIVLNPVSLPSLVISGNATVANYHFKDFVDNDRDYSGNLLPGTARNTWLLAANFIPVRHVELRAWYRYTGKMPVNDANTTFSDSYGLTNIELKYSAESGSIRYEIKGGIQNLLDVHYAGMLLVNAPAFGATPPRYYYPGNPRNYFVTVLLGWNRQ